MKVWDRMEVKKRNQIVVIGLKSNTLPISLLINSPRLL